MKFKKAALAAAALVPALLLAGCSHDEDPAYGAEPPAEAPTPVNPQFKKYQINTKDLLVETEKPFRRGAAVDAGGDKHFLDIQRKGCVYCDGKSTCKSPLLTDAVKYDPARRNLAKPATVAAAPAGNSILSRFRKGSSKDYSYYDLSRWERFCAGGWSMDSVDWKFVRSGKHPFPAELEATCKVPSRKMLRRHGFRL